MSTLAKLKSAASLDDVAKLLGFKPKAISFLLYILKASDKYHAFSVPKRNGGVRLIKAPNAQLKLLQRRLADLLLECLEEIEQSGSSRRMAHGFLPNKSIYTNASMHKRRRYVFNVDLQDFFPSINFGRVRGFFMYDKHFALAPKVATVIAQIACIDNELPQGSPCSPIISNLLAHIMDARLVAFSKKWKCTYTRYADDISFSTNKREFPKEIGISLSGSTNVWQAGGSLEREINSCGYKINPKKTRMQFRTSRQMATGLVVNEKVNISQDYYRNARAMCNQLFKTGACYKKAPSVSKRITGTEFVEPLTLNALQGMLAHIHFVKDRSDVRDAFEKKNEPSAFRKLYKKFLFYRYFALSEKPTIITEGKTDIIYLRGAIKSLGFAFPSLFVSGPIRGYFNVRLHRQSGTQGSILQLEGGSGELKKFIAGYKKNFSLFHDIVKPHAVVVLIDNDKGATEIFKTIKSVYKVDIDHASTKDFYHIVHNLYLVKTPESAVDSCIEDAFEKVILDHKLDGKAFDRNKEHEDHSAYGKFLFATKVVQPNASKINFGGFVPILTRLTAAIEDQQKRNLATKP